MTLIHPDNRFHKQFQTEVTGVLEQHGFMVGSFAYHDVLKKDLVNRLEHSRYPTSLCIRTNADCFAINRTLDFSFFVELKTNAGTYRNMALEALPLAKHRQDHCLGAITVYFYRDVKSQVEGAFFAHKVPCEKLFIPKGNSYLGYLKNSFPDAQIENRPSTDGSNDPYILVPESRLESLLIPWRKLIADLSEFYLVERR